EPILARPVGSVEKVVKWVRRRPTIAAALALAAAVAIGAGGIITWQTLEHRAELGRKERQREADRVQAEIELKQQEEANERQRREEEAKVAEERRVKARESYVRDIGLAWQEWSPGRADRADEVLD